MSQVEVTQQIQVTGSLLSLNIFEEKLMRNFYIVNTRLKKLDQIHELDIKIKALEKQQKFINSKMEILTEKLPKEPPISRNQIKSIVKDQFFDILNSKDDRLVKSKFYDTLLQEVRKLKVELAQIRVNQYDATHSPKKDGLFQLQNRASFTAGQAMMQQSKKMPKESLQDCLDNEEYNMVNNMIRGDSETLIDDINKKFQDLYQKIEQVKLGKMFNDYGEKDVDKFERYEKYEHYENKSQNTARKLKEKPIRLDGIKNQNVKGELLKNDLYSQYQKAQAMRSEATKNNEFVQKKMLPTVKGPQTLTSFKEDRSELKGVEFSDGKERLRPSKSLRKLERIERRLKVDDIKQLNGVLKQIELRIEGKVSQQIMMGFVEDIQEKLQILRITKDPSNELGELRRMIYSLDSRLQSVIAFLQSSMSDDDALLVKKQWTCISCDKQIEKYNGKIGQHLNWDSMNSKKLSPSKAGAFGQTGQLANKIRSLMDNQKGAQ